MEGVGYLLHKHHPVTGGLSQLVTKALGMPHYCFPRVLFLAILCLIPLSAVSSFTVMSMSAVAVESPDHPNDEDDNDEHHERRTSTSTSSGSMRFGRFVIPSSHIFYRTSQSAAFVNLRPIVPGHVLVMPHRIVATLEELTTDEYIDLWMSVRIVQQVLKKHYSTCRTDRRGGDNDDDDVAGGSTNSTRHSRQMAFNVAVQDGRAAGQSVPHVHVHLLPRIAGDFETNDDIYQELEDWAPRTVDGCRSTGIQVANDEDRVDRTNEMMAEEASWYRDILLSDTSKL